MSLDATRFAWTQKIKPSHKLILLSLADRADENNCCYPSIKRLELDTCLNRKTIMEGVKCLQENKIIKIEKALGKGNKYHIIGVVNRHEAVPKTGLVPKQVPVPKTAPVPVPKTGLGSTENGTGTSPKNGTLIYQSNLSTNLPTESKKHKGIDLSDLPTQISRESATGFIDHRLKIKRPLTQRAFQLSMDEATKAGDVGLSPNEIINKTVMKGWQGIDLSYFQDKTKTDKRQRKELAS